MAKTKSDATYQEARAREAEAKASASQAKADKQKYIAEGKSAKANQELATQIRQQEARKKKEGSVFKKISSAVKYSPKLSKTLLGYANAFTGGQSSSQRVQVGPGRPKMVYKHRSPFTGKPIDAPSYYKEVRAFRRLQEQRASGVQQQQLQQLAKRGVSPSQAQIIQQRMMQQRLLDANQNQMNQQQSNQVQMQQSRLPPPQVQTSIRPIWRRQNVVRTERDAFGNVKEILSGNDPRNFWN